MTDHADTIRRDHPGLRLFAWFMAALGAIVTYTLAAIDGVPIWTLWPALALAAVGTYKCWTVAG